MKPREQGRIIVITSLASFKPEASICAAHMAAKAGASHLRNITLELAAYSISVRSRPASSPPMFGHVRNPATQNTVAKEVPMHRVAFPEDMRGLALFLASPACGYITGAEIPIDGGWSLGTAG